MPDSINNSLGSLGLLDTFSGNGGDVIIDSRDNIILTNPNVLGFGLNLGLINSSSFSGDAGDITLIAEDTVSVVNNLINSSTLGTGKGGDISIQASNLLLQDGVITTGLLLPLANPQQAALLTGRGGDLAINVSDTVQINGSIVNGQLPAGLFTATRGRGRAGDLSITSSKLLVQNGGEISASTFSQGRGGDITINASESLQIIGISENGFLPSGLSTQTVGSGKAGDIVINSPRLAVQDGAFISAAVGLFTDRINPAITGDAGNLTINAQEIVISGTGERIVDAQLVNQPTVLLTATLGSGDGGTLTVNTDRLFVQEGGSILSLSVSQGNSGALIVNASESIELSGSTPGNIPSSLSSGAAGQGMGSDLIVNTQKLTIRDGAAILAGTIAAGTGGQLIINASDFVDIRGKASQIALVLFQPAQD